MSGNFTERRTRAVRTDWPDTTPDDPPADHPYRAVTWLLGRHPRLAARRPGRWRHLPRRP
jgi:hypothetical protein